MKINLLEIPVIYINLDKDIEKKEKIENSLKANNFKKIYRSPGILQGNHITGVNLAHEKALNLASNLGEEIFLILEDDVVFRECFENKIEVPDDFDAFYLGNSSWGLKDGNPSNPGPFTEYTFLEEMPNIVRIHNMLSAHAIIYRSKNYIKKIQEEMIPKAIEKTSYLDVEIAKNMEKYRIYAFSCPFFYQTSQARHITDMEFLKK